MAGHGGPPLPLPQHCPAAACPTITRAVAPVSSGRAEGIAPSTGEGSRSQKVRVYLQITDAAPHTSDPAGLPVSTPHHEPLWPLLTPPRRDPPTVHTSATLLQISYRSHDAALTQTRGGDPAPPVGRLPREAERGEWRGTYAVCVLGARTPGGAGRPGVMARVCVWDVGDVRG